MEVSEYSFFGITQPLTLGLVERIDLVEHYYIINVSDHCIMAPPDWQGFCYDIFVFLF